MAHGPKDPFDELVAPHLTRLFRVACRLHGNGSDAQDLVQDTCLAACQSLDQLADSAHPLRWLLRVQYNRFIDGARRRQRAPVVAQDAGDRVAMLPSTDPGPEDLLDQAEREGVLDRAFQQLDEVQRTLLSLRAEGYGLAEIETITGIGAEVLRARLHRARRNLAQRLQAQQQSDLQAGIVESGS